MSDSGQRSSVRDQLLQLARQMDEAIQTRQIDRLRKLMSKRRSLLDTIFDAPEYADAAEHIAHEALAEDRRWLDAFSDLRDGIQTKLNRLQRQRQGMRSLGGAYDPYTTRHTLISTHG